MDYQQIAERYLGYVQNTSGDYLNVPQEGTINALVGIGYALLRVAEAIESNR